MSWEEVGTDDGEQFKFTEPGQELTGKLLEVSNDIEGDNGTFRIWKFEVDGKDEPQKILVSGVLEDKLSRARGNVGDLFKVVFEGKKKSKKGREYNNWSVYIDRQTKESSWDDDAPF